MNDEVWKECQRFGIIQDRKELSELLGLFSSRNGKRILEIGTGTGGSARAFLSVAEQVVSIDIQRYAIIDELEKEFPDSFSFFQGDSQKNETVWEFEKKFEEESFDLLFIDGNHSRNGCIRDRTFYNRFVKKGGMVAFHDILGSARHKSEGIFVHDAWEMIKRNYKYLEIINPDCDWAGIGVLFND